MVSGLISALYILSCCGKYFFAIDYVSSWFDGYTTTVASKYSNDKPFKKKPFFE